jgi:preprotein translocase subunit SecD
MNKYPAWKYAIIIISLVLATLYAIPNIFGHVPTVQVAGKRETVLVDAALQGRIEAVLKEGGEVAGQAGKVPVRYTEILLTPKDVQVRFPDTNEQFRASSLIEKALGDNNYIVAMNLVSLAPSWLAKIGARPMALGLDLRGGVNLLMQVDLKKAAEGAMKRYAGDIRFNLRDKRIFYTSIEQQGDSALVVRFKENTFRDQARKELSSSLPDLDIRETGSGEDLQLILTVKPDVAAREAKTALEQNMQVLRKRVNELGVAEAVVQQQGADRIIVEVPGAQNPAQIKDIIGRIATLDVRNVAEEFASGPGSNAFEAYRDAPAPVGTDKYFDERGFPVLVRKQSIISGERIKDASANFDSRDGTPIVSVRLDEQGGKLMRQNTRENVKRRMAMLLIEKGDIKVLTWPVIQEELGANFQISGMESPTAAKNLALLLRAGALAAPMEFIEERTVGPSLGADNIEKGFNSVVWGFVLIAIFMVAYYMLFGVISVLSLGANLLFLIALLSLVQVTVTLPGIAAIALTLGMAIDANVLINERVREELRAGMSPGMAIQIGYERAFDTILDSNVTTLIAGLALLAFGSGPVRGFAVVHCLGILTSLFSAVMVSRGIVALVYGRKKKLASISIGNTNWSGAAAAKPAN